MNDQLMYDHLSAEIKKTVPSFKVINKKNSILMKILSKILFFNKDFMTGFFTTIYSTVYTPVGTKDEEIKFIWGTLAHEWVHMLRAKKNVAKFFFMYLFPISTTPLALLSILALWGSSEIGRAHV